MIVDGQPSNDPTATSMGATVGRGRRAHNECSQRRSGPVLLSWHDTRSQLEATMGIEPMYRALQALA